MWKERLSMSKDRIAEDIRELRAEAADARDLASTFEGGPTVRDLLNYAAALDREASQMERSPPQRLPWSLAACVTPLQIAERVLRLVRARSHPRVSRSH